MTATISDFADDLKKIAVLVAELVTLVPIEQKALGRKSSDDWVGSHHSGLTRRRGYLSNAQEVWNHYRQYVAWHYKGFTDFDRPFFAWQEDGNRRHMAVYSEFGFYTNRKFDFGFTKIDHFVNWLCLLLMVPLLFPACLVVQAGRAIYRAFETVGKTLIDHETVGKASGVTGLLLMGGGVVAACMFFQIVAPFVLTGLVAAGAALLLAPLVFLAFAAIKTVTAAVSGLFKATAQCMPCCSQDNSYDRLYDDLELS